MKFGFFEVFVAVVHFADFKLIGLQIILLFHALTM